MNEKPLDFFPADNTLLPEETKERLSFGETGEKPEKQRQTGTPADAGPQKDSTPISAAPESGKNMKTEKPTLPESKQEKTAPGEIVERIPCPPPSAANPERLRKTLTSARRWSICASVCGALPMLTLLMLLSTAGMERLRTWGVVVVIVGFAENFLCGIARKWAMIMSEAELRAAQFLNRGGEEVSQITQEIEKRNKRSGVLLALGLLAMAYVFSRMGGG